LLVVVFIGSLNLHAGFNYELGFVSGYVWRGMDNLPKNKPAVQPSITYTFGESGLSVNLWASFSMVERNELKQEDEFNITINYDFQISENLSLSMGMINYTFYNIPGYTFKRGNTQEFYMMLGFPGMFLGPSFSMFYDINLADGWYALVSVGHTLTFSEKTSLEVSASLAYNGKLYIDESGISDLHLSAALPISMGSFTITPSIHYNRAYLESLYREGNKKGKFWFGIIMTID
jgi:uncharacterized protein (TIGR02001 family)